MANEHDGNGNGNGNGAHGREGGRGLAVVTGASAGLGEALARELAKRGYDLLLLARREDRLRALADEIRAAGGGAARWARVDLGTEAGLTEAWRAVEATGETPRLWVNNAGFGAMGPALEVSAERVREMLRLNVEAVALTSQEAARRMVAAGRGGAIINVASTAAFQATPYMALYGATKGFELLFTEALNEELKGTGVRAFALCPGYTATEFQAVAGINKPPPAPFIATAEQCARRGLDAFESGQTAVYIDGAPNAVMQFAQRALPRALVTRMQAQMMKPR